MFTTFSAFRQAYIATGNHFFDKGTMRFFKSRIESGLLNKDGKQYFITSEADFSGENRYYNLRLIKDNLDIKTVGEFNTLKTKQAAKDFLKSLKN